MLQRFAGKSVAPKPSVAVKIGSEKLIALLGVEKFLARRRRKRRTEERVSLSWVLVVQRCGGKSIAPRLSVAVKIGSEKFVAQSSQSPADVD